jgi:hypothetical protein
LPLTYYIFYIKTSLIFSFRPIGSKENYLIVMTAPTGFQWGILH